jgi:hypothetical protein
MISFAAVVVGRARPDLCTPQYATRMRALLVRQAYDAIGMDARGSIWPRPTPSATAASPLPTGSRGSIDYRL